MYGNMKRKGGRGTGDWDEGMGEREEYIKNVNRHVNQKLYVSCLT
jgi:hypothetical protein